MAEQELIEAQEKPSPKKRMRLQRKKRYATSFKGDAEAEGVLATTDVFGVYPNGEIGRLRIDNFLAAGTMLYAHDNDRLPIGRAVWLEYGSIRRRGQSPVDGWTVGWKWAENDFAQQVRAEWDAKMIVAMSYGLGIRFDDDYEIDDVVLREASVVPVGADEGAVVASIDGPAPVLAKLKAGLNVDMLTDAPIGRILTRAASLAALNSLPSEEVQMAEAAGKKDKRRMQEDDDERRDEDMSAATESESASGESQTTVEAATAKPEVTVNLNLPEPAHPDAKAEATPAPSAVAQAAEGLVRKDFDLATASDHDIMVAALGWENPQAAELAPVELEEQFSALVARRNAARARLATASETSQAAAQHWRDKNGSNPGRERVEQARAKYLDTITNAWKNKASVNLNAGA